MNNRDQILNGIIDYCEEYLEMYPNDQWYIIANVLVKKLQEQMAETEYYKRLADVES